MESGQNHTCSEQQEWPHNTKIRTKTPQDENTTVLLETPSYFVQKKIKNKKNKQSPLALHQNWMKSQVSKDKTSTVSSTRINNTNQSAGLLETIPHPSVKEILKQSTPRSELKNSKRAGEDSSSKSQEHQAPAS